MLGSWPTFFIPKCYKLNRFFALCYTYCLTIAPQSSKATVPCVFKIKSQTFNLPNEDSGARHCRESPLAQRDRESTQMTFLLHWCPQREKFLLLLHIVLNTLQLKEAPSSSLGFLMLTPWQQTACSASWPRVDIIQLLFTERSWVKGVCWGWATPQLLVYNK